MASGKQSPRQRMINLMYLVFIAMLALNMSKEVLSAFGLLNEKLEESNTELSTNNQAFLSGLELKASENPAKFSPLYEKGKEIMTLSDAYFNYIQEIKNGMLSEIEDTQDYMIMDKADYIDQLFFKGDQLREEGQEFLDRRIAYRKSMLSIIPEEFTTARQGVESKFSTGDSNNIVRNREGNTLPWMNYYYEGYPLVASLTNLTQIQTDIKSSVQDVLKAMLQGQLSSEVSYSNYTTLLEQEKSAFYQGETFKGNIVLGRKDATTKPNEVNLKLDGRILEEGKDYTIEEGRVKLAVNAGNAGDHKLEGSLIFMQDGQATEVPVNSTFATITKPNSAVISADKMNVVYRGLPNPMTISIPGVADNFVQASATGLKKVKGSNYMLTPANQGREVAITATGKLPDGQTIKTTSVFRIKDIPKPEGSIRGESGTVKMPKSNLEISTVGAFLDDFDFDLKIEVNGFKIKVPGQPTVQVQGNKLDAKAKASLQRARRGDLIQIFDINAYITNNRSYRLKKVSSVIVELTN